MFLVIPLYIFFITDDDIVYNRKNKEILNKYIKEGSEVIRSKNKIEETSHSLHK